VNVYDPGRRGRGVTADKVFECVPTKVEGVDSGHLHVGRETRLCMALEAGGEATNDVLFCGGGSANPSSRRSA